MRFFHLIFFLFFTIACSTNMALTRKKYPPAIKYSTSEHSTLIIPYNYKPEKPELRTVKLADFDLNFYARQFVHGDVIYLEALPKNNAVDLEISVDGRKVFLTRHDWGYRGFFAIHPESEKNQITVKADYHKNLMAASEQTTFELEKKEFPVARSSMNLGAFSRTDIAAQKEIQERVESEFKEKTFVFNEVDPDHINNLLAHPRDFHQLNSPFYMKRIYEQFEIKDGVKINHAPQISYHRGLDFYAETGDPIFAMAPGKVALAKPLYYEGNCVFIDHGNKILSVYMHMSKINVHKDQFIQAGHLIGFAGSTGISTGAHLHVSMYVDSIPVDPLSLIYLPVRY